MCQCANTVKEILFFKANEGVSPKDGLAYH